ncbi:M23 family metallopeptidase [Pseudomarimonas salicorniae]|uniref:M23 family metallopeptidase n=1 Tax=Pseudomarimonas salicorniae TaxID=2933270 RepID=A0ABT0GJL0_9GAMM|nr:M23 family metallopeptidase [Lysobacter sp. CAU 1642]MCK7594739.1 M23 family metallopeptidase [Lysobacter sp. CAU 1642]
MIERFWSRLRAIQACAAPLFIALAAPATALELPSALQQGQLAIGRAQPGSEVSVDGRRVRVDAEGRFLLAAPRDAREPLVVAVRVPDGGAANHRVTVTPRDWPVEAVRGVPPRTVEPPPEIARRIAREQARVAEARRRDDARSDFASGFAWPVVGRISGRFAASRSYNGRPGSPHSGMDIAAREGTPIRAPAAGVVSFADSDLYLTGGTLLLDHGHGLSSVFLHMSRIDVRPGQQVAAGEVLGAVGSTGRATGPHLHWGVNWFEQRLDPLLLPGLPPAP